MEPQVLRRSLSSGDLIVYGLLFIGPLAPVGVFGVLDAKSLGSVALVYVVATFAMAFTALSYAQMSRQVPHAGSVYAYASIGIGRPAGFAAGWLAMLDYLLIPAVGYLFCGIALHSLVPSVPAWVFTAIAFVSTTVLNLVGVHLAARVGFVVLVVEIVLLAVFVVAAIVVLIAHGPARPWTSPVLGVGGTTTAAVMGAVSVAVLSFLGFDAIASFAEENTGDERQVGRAVLFCLAVAGLLFVVQTYLAGLLMPVSPQHLAQVPADQGTAFYTMTKIAIGPWMQKTFAVVKGIGPAFTAMAAVAAASRLLYGMARDRGLPKALASVDARSQVPRAALLTTAAISMVVSVWAARRSDGLDVLVSIVNMGALAAFTLLHVSVVGYFVIRHGSRLWIPHLVIPAVGAAVSIWIMVSATTLAKIIAAVWLAAGAVVYAVAGRRGPAGT
ncbi:APC family permease [Actinoallomurus bryophytorum]|uniref:Amino acid/polyamine/organocation transporter (APC superfamily) n=1 Tax=Actinoallomurus bryophytorum TaxID=1490222 RepID=A0A543CBW1_9ACTN|nr:APC family permease [Actinoallomurus bryophytorum]TQL94578.1 amino acid/polyamine/organocation transporter (APC superfamily) [Actinoallomurus bryophytorum]